MNWRSIITLFSLLAFFISTTGIVVFEHHCTEAGDFIGFYSDVDHDCGNENVEKSCDSDSSMHCCQKQTDEDVPKFEKDCCTTDVSLVKINSDYSLNNKDLDLERNFTAITADYKELSFSKERVKKESRGPPRFRNSQGRRRSLIQVYLI